MIVGLCCDKRTIVASKKISKYKNTTAYYPLDSYYSSQAMPPEWIESFLPQRKKLSYLTFSQDVSQKQYTYNTTLSRKESSPILISPTRLFPKNLKSVLESPKEIDLEDRVEQKSPIVTAESSRLRE